MTYEEIIRDNEEHLRRYAEMQRKWREDEQKLAAMNALMQMHIQMIGATMYMGLNPNLFRKSK